MIFEGVSRLTSREFQDFLSFKKSVPEKIIFKKLSMENCIFCKIIKKEIPCTKIYEDKNFLAFLDIQPLSIGHTLIIPKKHVAWMQEADDKIVTDIFKLSKKLMLAIKNALGCDYVQLSVIGKDVQHFHIHLIPRNLEDDLHQFSTKKYRKGEKEEVAQKIIQAL